MNQSHFKNTRKELYHTRTGVTHHINMEFIIGVAHKYCETNKVVCFWISVLWEPQPLVPYWANHDLINHGLEWCTNQLNISFGISLQINGNLCFKSCWSRSMSFSMERRKRWIYPSNQYQTNRECAEFWNLERVLRIPWELLGEGKKWMSELKQNQNSLRWNIWDFKLGCNYQFLRF